MVAVDFGATSIRVVRVALGSGPQPTSLDVVHRYRHRPLADGTGHLRWDWPRLVAEMERGLDRARAAGPVASIGIDTWGVDYGLLDPRGRLVAPPYSYRDHRTDGYRAVVDRIGEAALYRTTGIQLQPFNTIFQLAAHDRVELARARHLLMLPELLVHALTGEVWAERTSAGTTALVDGATGDWSALLLAAVGVDPALFAPIAPAGTCAGRWEGIPVHLVGGHDTASAVVAMGAVPGPGAAFVSAGTWLLVGREQSEPDVSEAARQANFSNEPGALGGVRFLRNLAGTWLIESCLTAWGLQPGESTSETAFSRTVSGAGSRVFDVADPRFLHPDDMLGEVTDAAGLPRDAPPAVVVRCIVESMAASTAGVLAFFDPKWPDSGHFGSKNAATPAVHVFGGGSQLALYRQELAARTGRPVEAGPVEATALGNALVQGIALGVYADLAEARASLAPAADGASR